MDEPYLQPTPKINLQFFKISRKIYFLAWLERAQDSLSIDAYI